MPFDALVIHSLTDEFEKKLTSGKIDKIFQPEKDEIILNIRNNNTNYKLVLSASASNSRAYIAQNYKKQNPIKAPDFCMTLRKHLQGGIITKITQIDFERIIKISIESYDELKEKTVKNLYVEIMGRNSNIILTHESNEKIIDSIKRVPFGVSRVRQILPGLTYESAPSQNKISPLSKVSKEVFFSEIKSFEGPIYKAIYSKFLGISPVVSKEICRVNSLSNASKSTENLDFINNDKDKFNISSENNSDNNTKDKFNLSSEILYDKNTTDVDENDLSIIYSNFTSLFDKIADNNYTPSIVHNKRIDKYLDFSCIELSFYKSEDFSSEFIHYDSISDVIENYYSMRDIKDRISQKSSDLKKSLHTKLERLKNKQHKQEKELKESKKANEYKVKGELLTAYIYMIEKGMKEIEVANFYSESYENITIPLKINLTPSENTQKYFKKYNKMKTAQKEISHQMEINKEEIDYLENTLLGIENCDNLEELEEIKEELIKVGYLKPSRKSKNKSNKKNTDTHSEPLKFISTDGTTILVGKNNKQNDYLTLRIADPDDIWMHTKNIPGSHVIIKCAGKEPSEQTLIEGATLSAYYSKSRMSAQVPVDYTKKKNVKKPSGSKPGLVIYETNNTLYITPTEEAIAKLKK
ncbi:MAG: NFACT family protein [Clostridioides sp.]|jgi:predicted ribosome quality control (RQC) complex YloA/Tae2 family protein|nr:NFACT family protein [Clostridioides sp.]